MKYICIISDNFSERQYIVGTNSALKCAMEYGRGNGGEIVSVYYTTGKLADRWAWSSEDRKYFRCIFDKHGCSTGYRY